jgi:type I restriction enzyme S subunit
MTTETFFSNFGHLADAPNGVQKLRELILQLAVQGKLVAQDPNDEPASVLLARIAAEKEKLVKEGKIKKQKPLSEIGKAEEPFALPNGWLFVRLGDIANRIGSGSTPRGGKNAYVRSGIPFLRSQNIWNNGLELQDVAYINQRTHQKMSNTAVLPYDILLNITGASLGRCTVYPEGLGESNVSQHVTIIRQTDKRTKSYLHLCILSPYTQALVWGRQVGMAREGLSKKILELFEIPLPPLEEQKRIVAKVDQLMALCNELEARQQKQQQGRVRLNNSALDALLTAREPDEFADHWQRISTNFDLLYDHPETIAKLRAAILQLAVQGKLVPQDPNDEPASVLLERIKAEKERLVKEGKLKKQKPLPIINEDLAPFTLPNGWSWASFPNVGEFGRGKSKHRPRNDRSLYVGGTYPMVQTGDVARANGEIKTYTALYNDVGLAQSRLWPKGTMCITIAANIADSSILGFDACFPDSVVGLIVSKQISNVRYFEYFMRTAKEHLMDFAPSTAQKNINLGILETVLIPLPPLAEIDRIVAKADQLMALCDELEAKLNQAQQHSEKLMEATVRQLLGTSTPQKPHTSRAPAAPAASKSVRPARHAYQPAPAIAEPIAAETAVVYGGSVPETILAAMQPGQEYSRAAILAATSIREADWMWAIKQLKEQRRVAQSGEKRGARYRLK